MGARHGCRAENFLAERPRELCVRPGQARSAALFQLATEVFEDFYVALNALARKAYDHGYGFADSPELPDDWHADAAAKLTRLGLYADRRVAAAASAAYGAAWSWGLNTKYDDPDDPEFYERQQHYDDAELELLVLM